MKIKIKEVVKYKGHNVSSNGTVKVSFTAMYSELTNSIQVLQLLNNDVKIFCKVPGIKDTLGLGSFRVKNVIIDGDGESVLKFESINDCVEMNNLNALVGSEEFRILMESDVEVEESDEE